MTDIESFITKTSDVVVAIHGVTSLAITTDNADVAVIEGHARMFPYFAAFSIRKQYMCNYKN
jgi:hypothetical protein